VQQIWFVLGGKFGSVVVSCHLTFKCLGAVGHFYSWCAVEDKMSAVQSIFWCGLLFFVG